MKEVSYKEVAHEIHAQLEKGAFLNVKDKDGNANTMTISWGNMGVMWFKPVFTVMVRYSRYTYELLQNAEDFTVSFPIKGQFKDELAFCGSKSGRDFDKFEELNLKIKDGKNVKSPILSDCDINLECKIICRQPLDTTGFDDYVHGVYGETKDYHVLFTGEIVSCLVK
jgi:flavin reductase (DIM6/NTAB) family NADH-FMN oxidoreductase RutF